MKKLFTPLMLFLTVLLGGLSASAEDEVIELTADMLYSWDGYGAEANKVSQSTGDFNVGKEVGAGSTVYGPGGGGVKPKIFADITGASKLIFEGTSGLPLRVLMNRVENEDGSEGAWVEKNPEIGEDGTYELDLTELSFVHINSIKVNWGAPSGVITSIKFVKPADPLKVPKEQLKNQISTAKMYNAIAYTEGSFSALQTVISEGENALSASDATVDSLGAAKSNIEKAIAALTLADGYSILTKEMFKKYASLTEPGEGESANGAYDIFKASGLPYGDGNVGELLWADITAYDKLIITTVGATRPRLCMNRLVAGGNQESTQTDSKMIDINPNNDQTWSNEAYQEIDGNVYTINLTNMVDYYGYARLHSIKKQGYGADVFVTGMYLYKDPNAAKQFDLTFDIDEPSHIIVKVNEEIKTLTAENNVLTVDDRAKLSISPSENSCFKSLMVNEENIVLPEDGIYTYTKTIVKPLIFIILTDGADPLADQKRELKAIIERASLYDSFAKSKESWEALESAVKNAEDELNNKKATAESLTTAGSNITTAIDGLEPDTAQGYAFLTPELFKKYASVAEPGTGEKTDCAYEPFTASGTPYGDGNINELKWADLSEYDQLIITTNTNVKPRILMNRLEPNGWLAETQEDSKMVELNPTGDSKNNWAIYDWADKAYQLIDGNKYTVNLKQIVDDYGFARLNSIQKQGFAEGVFITGMYLYKDPKAAREFNLSFDIDDPSRVVITVNGKEIEDLVSGNNSIKVADRAKLSIAPAEGCALKSLTVGENEILLPEEGPYTKTIVKELSYKIETSNTIVKKNIKLKFSVDDTSHVVISAGDTVIEDLSNETEVEENTDLSIAATEGYIIKSITANGTPVEIKDNKYEVTLDGADLDISFVITTELKAKADLEALIGKAKLYDSFAKTAESFAKLTEAIAKAEVAMAAENPTVESLTAAGEAIKNAIDGLETTEEYTMLTPKMYKLYDSVEDPGEGTDASNDCAYVLAEAKETPFGDSGVSELKWADLTNYDQLIITTATNTKPRVMMNRIEANGQQAATKEESKMIDINPNNGNKWSTEAYASVDNTGRIHTIDLKKIVADYDFARLHTIKGENYGWPTITGLYLYKAKDPLEQPKKELSAKIATAKLYDAYAKTAESFTALTKAITKAETALTAEDATVESLTAAGDAITAAIDGLVLAEGYENLTKDMFMNYPDVKKPGDVKNPGEGNNTGCAYVLFESTNLPYGDNNVSVNNWADLTNYDKLVVTMSGNTYPRVMMNREFESDENGDFKYDNNGNVILGSDGDSKETSKMLEMQAGKIRWSTDKYTKYDEENNVFTVDLRMIVEDWGFARLNAVKYDWGVNGIVTGMYLYTSTDDLELPLEALRNAITKAEQCDKYLKTEESLSALQAAIEEGKAKLEEARPTVSSVESVTKKINDAIEALEYQPGYSELTKGMFKRYVSVDNPGEGEAFDYNFKLGETSDQPLGGGSISELEWADLTNYDKLIFKVKEGTLRVLMNRLEFGGQAYYNPPTMLDMTVGDNYESTKKYLSTDDNIIYTVDLRKIVDDQDFARLHAVKSTCNITAIYLFKDPADDSGYNLTFNIDDSTNVVIEVNGEEQSLPTDNVLNVADRAKLHLAPADGYILKSVKANSEDVTPVMDETHDGTLTKTIVKNISYEITTEKIDPLKKPRIELKAAIENAELYDDVAKTKDSYKTLTDAIDAAKPLMTEDTTPALIADAIKAIEEAIEALELDAEAGYSYLTSDIFKKYSSVTEPGDGEETVCANETFAASLLPYGDKKNGYLNWADISEYDQLIITTNGTVGPRFYINRLEENGAQADTKEDSKMIDINPLSSDSWSYKYLTIEGNKYTVDLKKIVADFGYARLHSIQPDGYEQSVFVTGMYLYKAPFVAVTGISLDKSDEIVTVGETLTLNATVAPVNATDSDVTWSSSNPKVASVDENGVVTALEVGKAVITASCGEFTAKCTVKCHSTVGDANWDGKITVTDAVHISNYVVQDFEMPQGWTAEDYKEFYERSANVNGDDRVTFADASAAVNLALAQPVSTPEQNRVSAADDDSADALVIGHVSATSSGNVVPVALDNSMEYVALQADIILPEGMNVEVKAGSRVAGSHTFQTRKFADNHIRVAIYNLGNVAFADSDAPIFEVVTDSDIMESEDIVISNIYASDSKAVEYVLAARMAAPSAVAAIGFDATAPVKVFDLNGIYVSDTMEGLQQGTYIVRQGDEAKKVRIR
ncbi:MAG: FIVAR domain-containing protein [Muribaculaceae bacterium]|nr:FIVAR domain-containing protein [Muribaculaceae bacterium]